MGHEMLKKSIVSFTVLYSLQVFSNTKPLSASLSLGQVFELGLRGLGDCRIVPTFVYGYPALKVIGQKSSDQVGAGVVKYTIPKSKITFAHGLVYTPQLVTKFFDPDMIFPDSEYSDFKTDDPEKNAALMLILAIKKNRCGLDMRSSESQKKNIRTFNDPISFYFDEINNKVCISSFDHCFNILSPAVKEKGSCRSQIENKIQEPSSVHEPSGISIEALNIEEVQKSKISSLPVMTLAKAELAQRRPDVFSLIPLDNFLIDPERVFKDEKEQFAAMKLKLYFDSLTPDHMKLIRGSEDIKNHMSRIFENLNRINKKKYDEIFEMAFKEVQKKPAVSHRALRLTLESYFSPLKNIDPKLDMDTVHCE